MWTLKNPKLLPVHAAQLFVRDAFEGRRKLDAPTLRGSWAERGNNWTGTFSLVDGVKVYRLTCQSGTWSVDHAVREGVQS